MRMAVANQQLRIISVLSRIQPFIWPDNGRQCRLSCVCSMVYILMDDKTMGNDRVLCVATVADIVVLTLNQWWR